MKTLTINQPWANFLVTGVKKYETRVWKTNYRGPIAIHVGKKDIAKTLSELSKSKREEVENLLLNREEELEGQKGFIIATGDLVACYKIVKNPNIKNKDRMGQSYYALQEVGAESRDLIVPPEGEILLGDWKIGNYAWKIDNLKLLSEPISIRGQQRLWNCDLPRFAVKPPALAVGSCQWNNIQGEV